MQKLTALLIIIVLSISCSTDEPQLGVFSGVVNKSDLEGIWNVTDFYTNNGKISTKIEGINVNADFDSQGSNFQSQATFSQNPNSIASQGQFTNMTTISYLTFSQSQETTQPMDLAGTWSINNNIISITSSSITTDYTIVDFTGSSIKLKYDIDENLELINGFTGQGTATFYLTLTK
jgi:hypothetical protein